MKPQLVRQTDASLLRDIEAQVADLMSQGKPVRVDVPGGRFHIDRPLPFLVVHVGIRRRLRMRRLRRMRPT